MTDHTTTNNTTHTPGETPSGVRNDADAAKHLAAVLAPYAIHGIDLGDLESAPLLARAFAPNEDGTRTPRVWANDPTQLAVVLAQHAPPRGTQRRTEHPCPDWCEESAATTGRAHDFTFTDPNYRGIHAVPDCADPDAPHDDAANPSVRLYRIHRHRLGPNPTHVAVEARERVEDPAAPSDYGTDPDAITVALYGPAPTTRTTPGHLTPIGARELARQLLAAADLADAERATASRRTRVTSAPTSAPEVIA